jgi:uncharacterized lipoprotein YddW (UPF0748 family)
MVLLGVSAMLLTMLTTQVAGPSPAPREFRGVWVATVDNIDWPSKPGLSTSVQKRELLAILDKAAALRLNAVVFQVRPMADALYRSPLEPWSYFLTGKQGLAPDPEWDPLAFAVTEAHLRGLELHAWLNPFRAKHPADKSPLADSHVGRTHPAWVKSYGKFLWLDPGELQAREHSLNVVLDIVKRYDVDGIHIDDYFYPYPEHDPKAPKGKKTVLDFPDEPSWNVYREAGGSLARNDWRRQNVDRFIQEMYKRVKTAKPWVKVGISPFGIYRPGYPATVQGGFDQYAQIYADPKLWLEQGWCDYLSPQLYWKIDSKQPYAELLKWWLMHNPKERFIWPGSYTSLVRPENKDWPVQEIVEQIALSRHNPPGAGHIHFSAVALMKDSKGLGQALKKGPYSKPALTPALTWLRVRKPNPPSVVLKGENLVWSHTRPDGVRFWVLYVCRSGKWEYVRALPKEQRELSVEELGKAEKVSLAAFDRYGQESGFDVVNLK